MHRSLPAYLAVIVLAFCIVFGSAACGGGGGGGSSSDGGSDGGNGPTPTVLALVATSTSDSVARDLGNTVAGETLTVRALVVDTTGAGKFVTLSRLRTTAPSSVATINSSAHTLTAVSSSSSSYTVTGEYNGRSVSASLSVVAPGTRVSTTGLVRRVDGAGVAGATVRFYNASGTLLGQVLSGPDGRFQGNLPPTTARLSADVTALLFSNSSSIYYTTYFYSSAYYDATFNCPAPIANFSGGTLNDLVFTLQGGTIPPPPTGCTGSGS